MTRDQDDDRRQKSFLETENLNPDLPKSPDEQADDRGEAAFALEFLEQVRKDMAVLDNTSRETYRTEPHRDTPPLLDNFKINQPIDLSETKLEIGRFEIKDTVGEGGFSHVFRALDPLLDRDVAIKVPKPHVFSSEEDHLRFAREAQATALLSHPAILPVFETGKSGIFSYIVSPFCEGVNLRQWLESFGSQMTPQLAAELVASMADAAHHAHQRNIIHRDLKPDNIMIEDGEGSVANRIRITDFGLAKFTRGRDQKLTQTAAIVGTPLYMSPEQAAGSGEVGHAADIFSIGVILFELLTGQLPFKKENSLGTLRAIENDPAPKLRSIDQTIPRDLEAICLKCLEKKPSDRFESAFELAEELRRWSDGRPVKTRQVSSLEQFSRWCRRNPQLAAVSAFAVVSLLAGLSATTWQWRNAVINEAAAKKSAQEAIDAKFAATQSAEEARKSRDAAIEEQKLAEEARTESDRFSDYFVERVMAASKPVGIESGQGKDVTVREMLSSMETHLEQLRDLPRVEAKVRNAFGGVWREMGEYNKAAKHFLKVQELTGSQLHNRQSLQSTLEMGSILFAKGEITTAKNLLQSTYPSAIEILGKEHALTIGYLNNLATILLHDGNYDESTKLFREVLEMFTKRHGPEHPATQTVTVNLAGAYRQADDNASAIALLEPQLELQLRTLGKQNYQTMRTTVELAESLSRAGKPEQAAQYLKDAVEIGKETLGPDHPKTIEAMLYQAKNLQRLGDADLAIDRCNEAISVASKKFGEYHPVVNQATFALIQILAAAQRYEQSVTVISNSIDLHKKNNNLENAYRWVPRLVEANLKLGRYAEVEKLANQYREPVKTMFGDKASWATNLDSLYAMSLAAEQKKWSRAAEVLASLIERHQADTGQTILIDRSLAAWQAGYANCLIELNRDLDQAKILAGDCLVLLKQIDADEGELLEANSLLAFFDSSDDKAAQIRELESIHKRLADLATANPSFELSQKLEQSQRRLDRIRKLKSDSQAESVVDK